MSESIQTGGADGPLDDGTPPEQMPPATTDPAWLLVEEGFHPVREHEIESLLAVSNGYLGTRAALAEGSALSSPATFVAGVFAVGPRPGAVPELVSLPDWTALRRVLEGDELRLDRSGTLEHRRILDLRQGITWREWRHRDAAGRITRILGLRLASLAQRHLVIQSVLLEPVNYGGPMIAEARIDPPVGAGAPFALEARRARGVLVVTLRPSGSPTTIAFAAATALHLEPGAPLPRKLDATDGSAIERWEIELAMGRPVRLDRLVAVFTSRDGGRPVERAVALASAPHGGLGRLVADHAAAWDARWRRSDVEVTGDPAAQRALRFACYHLIGAANPDDERASIGARALTGRAYQGHVFWDTEIYLLPFYTWTDPAAARALLRYRVHTLPAARDKARSLGYRGALFAWESADDGREATPRFMVAPDGEVLQVRCGDLEQHISADVAYAAWSYLGVTGDDGFLAEGGAELLVETARFWASRSRLEGDGRYHIRNVIGPDEYHVGVDDNAFTNAMARFNLERAAAALRLLGERHPERLRELVARLGLSAGEPSDWRARAAALTLGFDARTGLFEQFAGFHALERLDPAMHARRPLAADDLFGRDRIRRAQVVKQPDVVMLVYLLWDELSPEVRAANFRHYEPLTVHGSSLSPSVHALVAARLGDRPLATHYFQQGAEIDLADTMGNAAGGVHAAALGALWQAAVFGFAGMRAVDDGVALDPHLPPAWRSLAFAATFRGNPLRVALLDGGAAIEVLHEGTAPVRFVLGEGAAAELEPGRHVARHETDGRWGPWRRA